MKAIQIFKHGDAEELTVSDLPIPEISQGEVLIQVKAISLNHFDILSRKGIYPNMKLPRVIGMDCAGIIAKTDSETSKWKIGDRVIVLGETLGLGGPGAYSEFVNVPEEEIFSLPENLTYEEGSSIGISYLTAYYAIKVKLGDIKNKVIFIPGASGGVATALIQFAKYFGAIVIAASRSDLHCQSALTLGADFSINSNADDLKTKIYELTNGKGVDIAINSVGGSTIPVSMNLLKKKGGQLVVIGSAAGRNVEIDIFQLLIREMTVIGCNFGSLIPQERGEIFEELKKILTEGKLKIALDRTFPLTSAKEAHLYMESGSHFGKIILKP
ncbi:MAG: zinc-binding alcohol dehydrogenase family protein [Leptospira sp.]|nr:zinc-binding alcohol dehydrogenase family protein [Leptospira sp.]